MSLGGGLDGIAINVMVLLPYPAGGNKPPEIFFDGLSINPIPAMRTPRGSGKRGDHAMYSIDIYGTLSPAPPEVSEKKRLQNKRHWVYMYIAIIHFSL